MATVTKDAFKRVSYEYIIALLNYWFSIHLILLLTIHRVYIFKYSDDDDDDDESSQLLGKLITKRWIFNTLYAEMPKVSTWRDTHSLYSIDAFFHKNAVLC